MVKLCRPKIYHIAAPLSNMAGLRATKTAEDAPKSCRSFCRAPGLIVFFNDDRANISLISDNTLLTRPTCPNYVGTPVPVIRDDSTAPVATVEDGIRPAQFMRQLTAYGVSLPVGSGQDQ